MSERRYQMGFVRHLCEGVEQMTVDLSPTIVSASIVARRRIARGWRLVKINKADQSPLDEIEFDAFAILVSRKKKNGT